MKAELTVIVLAIAGLAGCASNKAPDVAGKVRTSLQQAGLNDVTVSQDRDKAVVTLGGSVNLDADKVRAEQIAQSQSQGDVVSNQIAVLPNSDASSAKTVNSDLDKGIDENLNAAYTEAHLKGVHHSVKNGVVTLTGELPTPAMRSNAEKIAGGVPNVQQVVNEIGVKHQRATSSSADRSKQ